jgi:hypothetical protein
MKFSAINFLISTTFLLLTVFLFTALDFPFNWIFYLTVLGQTLLVFTVFKVLKDNYTTTKTFKDFYEDHPIGREE